MRIITILCLWACLATSCTKEIEGSYTDDSRIYFEYLFQDPNYYGTRLIIRDSLIVSLGKLDKEIESYEVKIPLKLLGLPLTTEGQYKVHVLEAGIVLKGKTTAQENIHYLPLKESYQFRKDEWTDTLKVTVLRSALNTSFTAKESKTLMLGLEETADLKLGMRDGWEIKMSINNFLEKPSWWREGGLGYYHPEKYRILLLFETEEFYASVDILNNAKRYIAAMKSYLEDHVVIDEETGKRVGFDSLIDL